MRHSPLQKSLKRGFTLIEIMVATVIMVILVGLVIEITSEVLKVWNRSSGKLSANAEARIAMDLLTQDLETAVFRNNGQQWLRVEAPVDPGGEYTNQTVALKLFSPALDRDQSSPGDICAIAYRLAYQASYTGGEDVYALYRYIAPPDETFNNLMGSSSSSSPQISLTGGVWDAGNVTSVDNYLVGNIVEFKVLIYEDTGQPGPTPVNGNANGDVVSDYAYGGDLDGDGAAEPIGSPLLYADVVLTVVSDEGLNMLQNIDRIPESAADVVREHGEVFTRRVYFPARAL